MRRLGKEEYDSIRVRSQVRMSRGRTYQVNTKNKKFNSNGAPALRNMALVASDEIYHDKRV